MAVILALIIKTFFLQAFYIPSGSMRPSLEVDDRILVQKMSYWFGDVHRGDVVVFDDPAGWLGGEDGHAASNAVTKSLGVIGLYPTGGHLVKRVIGVGGDVVACASGDLSVNGTVLKEDAYVTLPPHSCTANWNIKVPDDNLWVMGDNRTHSADSRAHMGDPGGGFIPVDDVVGEVFVVAWPIKRWDILGRPASFDKQRLDQAAGLVTPTVPVGLAWVLVPLVPLVPLVRRVTRPKSGSPDDRKRDR